MNAYNKKPPIKPIAEQNAVVEQTMNNATSWIGHHTFDNKDIIGGQTFVSPADGNVDAIEVFTSIVTTPGKVVMTIHGFDPELKQWGPALGSAGADFITADTGKWKSFNIPGLHVTKGKSYGFRMESANCYIGMGEAAGHTPPLANGQEWKFIDKDQQGKAFTYFSLAFKVAVKA